MSDLIDTPAEGFPLPTMTPPTRTLRDVASRLTAGGRERARQRASVTDTAAGRRIIGDALSAGLEDGLRVTLRPDVEQHLAAQAATSAWLGELIGESFDREAAEREALTVAAFDGGRAYERGAALRRGVGKSFGSRRVQAEGVAGDYLREDPQDGARLAALVLAGFSGQDPAAIR